MNVRELESTPDKSAPLKTLKPGQVFRFRETSYSEALVNEDGAAFYMVVAGGKEGRVSCVSLDGAVMLQRDEDRPVIVHRAEIHVER